MFYCSAHSPPVCNFLVFLIIIQYNVELINIIRVVYGYCAPITDINWSRRTAAVSLSVVAVGRPDAFRRADKSPSRLIEEGGGKNRNNQNNSMKKKNQYQKNVLFFKPAPL